MTARPRHTLLSMLLLAALLLPGPLAVRADDGPRTLTGEFVTTNPIYPMIGADIGVVLYELPGEIQQDYGFVPAPEAPGVCALSDDISGGSYTHDPPDRPAGARLHLGLD